MAASRSPKAAGLRPQTPQFTVDNGAFLTGLWISAPIAYRKPPGHREKVMARNESLVALNGTQVSSLWKVLLSDFARLSAFSPGIFNTWLLKSRQCLFGLFLRPLAVSRDTVELTLQSGLSVLQFLPHYEENNGLHLAAMQFHKLSYVLNCRSCMQFMQWKANWKHIQSLHNEEHAFSYKRVSYVLTVELTKTLFINIRYSILYHRHLYQNQF